MSNWHEMETNVGEEEKTHSKKIEIRNEENSIW